MNNQRPLMSRRSAPFRDQAKNKVYYDAAMRAYNGEFGSRSARDTSSQEASLFWQGYEGVGKPPPRSDREYVFYKLGEDVRRNDATDEKKLQFMVNGKALSKYQHEVYSQVQRDWVSAEWLSAKIGGDSKSVGGAMMLLARRGLLERKPTHPPYYRRKN